MGALLDFGSVGAQHLRTDTAAGLSSWRFFDGLNRIVSERQTGPDNGSGNEIVRVDTAYNNLGQVSIVSEPYFESGPGGANGARYFEYDALGRQKEITHPDGTRTLICYTLGKVATINPKNQMKLEERDVFGRLTRVEEYTGNHPVCLGAYPTPYAITEYEYDTLGNLENVTDDAENLTSMQYDSLSRKVSMNDPDMGTWFYLYDAVGNLIEQTDNKGQKIFFQYDDLNRIRQKDYGTLKTLGIGDVQYSYDTTPTGFTGFPKGRLSQVVDGSGTIKFGYDKMGQIIRTDKIIDGTTYNTETEYDIAGRVSELTYPDGTLVFYDYNGPLLERVYNNVVLYAKYDGYNAFGQPSKVSFGNGTWTDYTYSNSSNAECPFQNQRLCRVSTNTNTSISMGNVDNYEHYFAYVNGDVRLCENALRNIPSLL